MLEDARDLLTTRGRFEVSAPGLPWRALIIWIAAGGGLYGLGMGSLNARWMAGLYSAAKVPLLVFGATLLCLPSFYVLNSLLGLRSDFRIALRGILASQGTVAVCLAALAPVLVLFYLSELSYPAALLLNATLFGVAAVGGQSTLRRHYAALIAKNKRHRWALGSWFGLYVFVSLKLGWILRPFVGDPDLPLEFVRSGQWMDDPYTNLFWAAVGLGWRLLGLD